MPRRHCSLRPNQPKRVTDIIAVDYWFPKNCALSAARIHICKSLVHAPTKARPRVFAGCVKSGRACKREPPASEQRRGKHNALSLAGRTQAPTVSPNRAKPLSRGVRKGAPHGWENWCSRGVGMSRWGAIPLSTKIAGLWHAGHLPAKPLQLFRRPLPRTPTNGSLSNSYGTAMTAL